MIEPDDDEPLDWREATKIIGLYGGIAALGLIVIAAVCWALLHLVPLG